MVETRAGRPEHRWLRRLAAAAGALLICSIAAQPLAASADNASAPAAPAPNRATCKYTPTHRVSQIRDGAIREASGLVASQQFPGVFWTLNDSGNAPMLF